MDHITITRVVGLDLTSPRPKLVGMNSRLGVHGEHSVDRVVKLYASDGTEGFGCSRAQKQMLAGMLGRTVTELVKTVGLSGSTFGCVSPSAINVLNLD